MTIQTTARESSAVTLTLQGRLDTATAPQLQEALLPLFAHASEVLLDFSGVAYVSSAGLRVLLLGQKAARKTGAAMALRGVSPDVMEVFDMTGFSGMLTIL